MNKPLGMLLGLATILVIAGCHNGRMGCGCLGGSCMPGMGAPQGSVIAPPPTYSVRAPNSGTSIASNSVPPNTVPSSPASVNSQSGWQSGAPLSVASATTSGPGDVTQELLPPPMPGGNSYQNSVNYQSTIVNEQQDSTRLAATDASLVAPTTMPTWNNNPTPGGYHPGNTVNGTFTNGQQPILINGQVESAPPQYAQPGNPYPPYGYTAQYPPNYGQAVLASSTTIYDPDAASGAAGGWRDRETEGSFSR